MNDTSFAGFSYQRKAPICLDEALHGQHRWLWCAFQVDCILDKMAVPSTALVASPLSMCQSDTSTAMRMTLRYACPCLSDDGNRRSLQKQAYCILGTYTAEAALRPRAITSGQNKKRPSHPHPIGLFHGSGAGLFGRWLRRFNIHVGLLSAKFAFAWQVARSGVGIYFQDFTFSADGADHPSVLYAKFITFQMFPQCFSLTFY